MQSESNKITKAEWKKLFPKKYWKAQRLGLLPEIYKEMGWIGKKIGEHTKFTTAVEFVNFINSLDIKSLTDWQTKHLNSYRFCCGLGLQKQVAALCGWKGKKDHSKMMTIDDFIDYIKLNSILGPAQWNRKHSGNYHRCCELGLQKAVAIKMGWPVFQSFETIEDIVDFIDKSKIKTKQMFMQNERQAYVKACKLGLMERICNHFDWNYRKKTRRRNL